MITREVVRKIMEIGDKIDFDITFEGSRKRPLVVIVDNNGIIPHKTHFVWDTELLDEDELYLDFRGLVLDEVDYLCQDGLLKESDRLHELFEVL